MLTLPHADFSSFALRTPDKSSPIATLIEQSSNRVLPPFKIHFPSSAPAHKSQILELLSLTAALPHRNYHGITSLCVPHRITSIDSHPCKISGGVGVGLLRPLGQNTAGIARAEVCSSPFALAFGGAKCAARKRLTPGLWQLRMANWSMEPMEYGTATIFATRRAPVRLPVETGSVYIVDRVSNDG
jgi:hypothetical protein